MLMMTNSLIWSWQCRTELLDGARKPAFPSIALPRAQQFSIYYHSALHRRDKTLIHAQGQGGKQVWGLKHCHTQ